MRSASVTKAGCCCPIAMMMAAFQAGNMQRPAMLRLLADVAAGKIDTILIYKIDRLTRSLADFAKIVEVLDKAGASFVSITQSFNTTTSMGRLTLNMLLSFAQFEREVTGERIRDKIAASKRKGMWMGGPVPLGYDVEARKLIPNEAEAELVRHIYRRYLALRSVEDLADELNSHGHRTKVQNRASGPHRGGCPFRRGTLYHLLANRIYRGELGHKGEFFPAEHAAIIPARSVARSAGQTQGQRARHIPADRRPATELARRTNVGRGGQGHDPQPCDQAGKALPLLHHPARSHRWLASVAGIGARCREAGVRSALGLPSRSVGAVCFCRGRISARPSSAC